MPTELDNVSLCTVCKQPRVGHYQQGHSFSPAMAKSAPGTLMDCSCGNKYRSDVDQVDVGAMHAALREAGWRIITGAWKCPRCGQRFDRAQDRKRAKERDAKTHQIGGW